MTNPCQGTLIRRFTIYVDSGCILTSMCSQRLRLWHALAFFFFFPSFSLLQISLFFSSFFFLVALHLVSVALVRLLLAAGRPSGASKKRRLSQLGPALTVRLSCSGDEVKHFLEFSFSFWRQDPIFDWMNIQAYPDAVGEVQQAHHMQHWTLISTNYTIIRQG